MTHSPQWLAEQAMWARFAARKRRRDLDRVEVAARRLVLSLRHVGQLLVETAEGDQ